MPDCFGHVAELAVAFVVEQAVAFERGDVDVVAAVVVVVADGDAHAVDLDVEAAAARDVGERAVVIVAIERGGGVAAARGPVLAVDRAGCRASRRHRHRRRRSPAPMVSGRHFLPGASRVVRELDARRRR